MESLLLPQQQCPLLSPETSSRDSITSLGSFSRLNTSIPIDGATTYIQPPTNHMTTQYYPSNAQCYHSNPAPANHFVPIYSPPGEGNTSSIFYSPRSRDSPLEGNHSRYRTTPPEADRYRSTSRISICVENTWQPEYPEVGLPRNATRPTPLPRGHVFPGLRSRPPNNPANYDNQSQPMLHLEQQNLANQNLPNHPQFANFEISETQREKSKQNLLPNLNLPHSSDTFPSMWLKQESQSNPVRYPIIPPNPYRTAQTNILEHSTNQVPLKPFLEFPQSMKSCDNRVTNYPYADHRQHMGYQHEIIDCGHPPATQFVPYPPTAVPPTVVVSHSVLAAKHSPYPLPSQPIPPIVMPTLPPHIYPPTIDYPDSMRFPLSQQSQQSELKQTCSEIKMHRNDPDINQGNGLSNPRNLEVEMSSNDTSCGTERKDDDSQTDGITNQINTLFTDEEKLFTKGNRSAHANDIEECPQIPPPATPEVASQPDQTAKTETQIKSHTCHICCKSYHLARMLKRHLKTHNMVKRYACHYCTKGFNDTFDLKRHVRTHTGVRPYRCDYCPRSFTQRCSLESHRLKVHAAPVSYNFKERRDKVFVCEDCGYTDADCGTFREHIATHHPDSIWSDTVRLKSTLANPWNRGLPRQPDQNKDDYHTEPTATNEPIAINHDRCQGYNSSYTNYQDTLNNSQTTNQNWQLRNSVKPETFTLMTSHPRVGGQQQPSAVEAVGPDNHGNDVTPDQLRSYQAALALTQLRNMTAQNNFVQV